MRSVPRKLSPQFQRHIDRDYTSATKLQKRPHKFYRHKFHPESFFYKKFLTKKFFRWDAQVHTNLMQKNTPENYFQKLQISE